MGLLDLLFPKWCIGCGKWGTYFCALCIARSKLCFPQKCPVCARNALDGVTHLKCRGYLTPDGLISIWQYTGTPKKLIQKLKYKFVSQIALSLAAPTAGMLKTIRRSSPETPVWAIEQWLLVPIPLHWKRQNWRGFNQAEQTLYLLSGLMKWPVAKLLVRKASSTPQVGLRRHQRQHNVTGVFSLNSSVSVDKNTQIILFDDVWTTGSTLKEATKVLKKAGYKKVWCLTLAR